jgi:catechol 2,3-dioxygenase-like lactoylglutathione lyase family enzyme
MIQVRRLAHATFGTRDIDREVDYWTKVIGLSLVHRDKDRAFLATKLGQEAIALERGEPGQLKRIAFQVAPGTSLREVEAGIAEHGIKTERRSDVSPGVKEVVTFTDLKGTALDICAEYQFADDDGLQLGIMPIKFGHLAYRVNDPKKHTDFYCQVLGFKVSDWIGDRFSFLRCGPDHHTVNFARYAEEALHHIAFEVKDAGALNQACDFLAKSGIHLVWGPIRHIVGHNIAAYHRNADDIRVELFCELDLMKDEALGYFDPRPWHEDRPQRPKVWPDDTLRSQWGFGSFGTFPGYP